MVVATFARSLTAQSSTQCLTPLPVLHLHQLPARMEIHHARRSPATNRRRRSEAAAAAGSCLDSHLAPSTWPRWQFFAAAFSFAGIPLHFADCRDNCRLPPFWLFAANSRRINLISPSSVHRPCCLGPVPRCEMV